MVFHDALYCLHSQRNCCPDKATRRNSQPSAAQYLTTQMRQSKSMMRPAGTYVLLWQPAVACFDINILQTCQEEVETSKAFCPRKDSLTQTWKQPLVFARSRIVQASLQSCMSATKIELCLMIWSRHELANFPKKMNGRSTRFCR